MKKVMVCLVIVLVIMLSSIVSHAVGTGKSDGPEMKRVTTTHYDKNNNVTGTDEYVVLIEGTEVTRMD